MYRYVVYVMVSPALLIDTILFTVSMVLSSLHLFIRDESPTFMYIAFFLTLLGCLDFLFSCASPLFFVIYIITITTTDSDEVDDGIYCQSPSVLSVVILYKKGQIPLNRLKG